MCGYMTYSDEGIPMEYVTYLDARDIRIKELEDQVIIQDYVISFTEGGLDLISKRLATESKLDLIPQIKAAVEAYSMRVFGDIQQITP